jgi:hypothetical protein
VKFIAHKTCNHLAQSRAYRHLDANLKTGKYIHTILNTTQRIFSFTNTLYREFITLGLNDVFLETIRIYESDARRHLGED